MKTLAHFHRVPFGTKLLLVSATAVLGLVASSRAFGAAFDRAWGSAAVMGVIALLLLAFTRLISRRLLKELKRS